MNFNMFQVLSEKTMPEVQGDLDLKLARANYTMGTNNEAGELGDLVKKHLFHGHEMDKQKFAEEAGDVLHYLSGLCTMYGVLMDDVADQNLKKLQGKGGRYEQGFSHEASRNRKD